MATYKTISIDPKLHDKVWVAAAKQKLTPGRYVSALLKAHLKKAKVKVTI
jgi:hypothetical protein